MMKLNPFTFSWCNPELQSRRGLFNGKGPVKGGRSKHGVYILLDAKVLFVRGQILFRNTIDNTHVWEFDLEYMTSQHRTLRKNQPISTYFTNLTPPNKSCDFILLPTFNGGGIGQEAVNMVATKDGIVWFNLTLRNNM